MGALIRARRRQQQEQSRRELCHRDGPVVFLGMDSPEMPLDEIAGVFAHYNCDVNHETASSLSTAILCPSEDGGYGMLSIPPSVSLSEPVFANVRWSQSLTAISQLKALTDANVPVKIGRLMYDIDEPEDVQALARRLQIKDKQFHDAHHNNPQEFFDDNLLHSSATPGLERTSNCPRTRKVLVDFGFLDDEEEDLAAGNCFCPSPLALPHYGPSELIGLLLPK